MARNCASLLTTYKEKHETRLLTTSVNPVVNLVLWVPCPLDSEYRNKVLISVSLAVVPSHRYLTFSTWSCPTSTPKPAA